MKGYINCRIHGRQDTAFLVDEGRFVQFGSDEEISQKLGWQDETIDCKGMYVMPGFIAGGMNLLERGRHKRAISLSSVRTIPEVRRELLKYLDQQQIIAWDYRPDLFEGELERTVLDEITNEKPVIVFSEDLNLAVLNSRALEKADPDLDSEEEGNRGILTHEGMQYVHDYLAVDDLNILKETFLRGCEDGPVHGVTTAVSDDFAVMSKDYKAPLTMLEQLAYQQKLPLHVLEDCTFRNAKEYAAFLDEGYTEFVENYNLAIGRLKIRADGSLISHTAALTQPYQDKAGVYGVLHYIDKDMEMLATLANHFNSGVAFEADGDGAVDQVLDILEDMMYEGNPLKDMLSPCALVSKGQLSRIISHQIACGLAPSSVEKNRGLMEKTVERRLMRQAYPYHTLFEKVPVMGIAADGNVLQAVEDAVTREDDERLSLDEALSLYTDRAAEALMIYDHTGFLKEGYDADFTVLEQDPHEVDVHDIHRIKVMITEVRGETVFER